MGSTKGEGFTRTPRLATPPRAMYPELRADLLDLLWALDGVPQHPVHHPEGDALYHSLQVFQHAREESGDAHLWAAALLHDVAKAVTGPDHDVEGARMLDPILGHRVAWLTAHHLDLLRRPGKTRRRFKGTQRLADLERLRRWDLAGRDPQAHVCTPEDAVDHVVQGLIHTNPAADAVTHHGDSPSRPHRLAPHLLW